MPKMVECTGIPVSILLILIVLPATVTKTYYHGYHIYNGTGIEIKSPKFPSTYDFDGNIHKYIIQARETWPGIHLRLTFSDFQLDTALSLLRIYDGRYNDNTPSSSWTGSRPPVFITSGKLLTIIFKPGTKPDDASGFNYVGFKVRVSAHDVNESRSSPLIGQPELPRLIPAVGFCGYLYTTFPPHQRTHLALSGHQVSPAVSDAIGEENITMECFWSGAVISREFYLSVKYSPGISYSVHNGRTSDDEILMSYLPTTYTENGAITTFQPNNGSFYVRFSGTLEKTDYFAFSFAPKVDEAVLLVKGLQRLPGTSLCPFKSCDSRCVWDWLSCHDNGTGSDISPDCDQYDSNLDIKSCHPNQTHDETLDYPDRCYRESVDACDGFVDCLEYEEDESHCPSGPSDFSMLATLPLLLFVSMCVVCGFAVYGCWRACCKEPRCECFSCCTEMCEGVCGMCQAIWACGSFIVTKLRDCCRSTPGVVSVEVNDVAPAPTAPPVDTPASPEEAALAAPPGYHEMEPMGESSHLPSYDEAMERQRVVSDRKSPPPSYLSVW